MWLILAEIDHPALTQPARIVNNTVDIVSNLGGPTSYTFTALPFTIILPGEDENVPQATMKIDNVDLSMSQVVQSIPAGQPPTCAFYIVLASNPNVVEIEYSLMLTNIEVDVHEISGTFSPDDSLNEPFPGDTVTPSTYPGLF